MGLSPAQFRQLERRLASPRRAAATAFPATAPDDGGRHAVVLGLDPSLRGTGFGVVRAERGGMRAVEFGHVACPAGWSRSRCLVAIAARLREVIRAHRPTACAIEGLFFAQNLQTALIMGEARGVALLAAAEAGLETCEIAPRKMKQAIVGYGGARKDAVGKMVQRMLRLAEPPQADAADALALAVTFLHETGRHGLSAPKRL
ncbi:MAG: crossover junction endodeoxyribonuclease RuvC [Limisphaerales bacterium]